MAAIAAGVRVEPRVYDDEEALVPDVAAPSKPIIVLILADDLGWAAQPEPGKKGQKGGAAPVLCPPKKTGLRAPMDYRDKLIAS